MRYRFHYQTDGFQAIIAGPIVNPQLWEPLPRPYAAVAYIQASSLRDAYERYNRAVAWWNDHLQEVLSQWNHPAYEGVELFLNDYTRERIAPHLAQSISAPVRRRPLRPPLPGDVFQPVNGYGHMLVRPADETHPFQWLWMPPPGAVPCSEEVPG